MTAPPTTEAQPPEERAQTERVARRALDPVLVRHVLLACGLSLVLTTVISVVDYIPTHDGPNTIVHGYLALHLHDPGKGYDRFLERNTSLSSRAFDAPFTLLLHWLSWQDALRVTLSLGALLWAWGFFALLAVLEPRRLAFSALGFATALSWAFYMGFFSYWIASGLALLVLAAALACKQWSVRSYALLAAAVVVVVLAHSFVGILLGVVLVTLTSVRNQGRERWQALFRLAVAGTPGVLLAALSSPSAAGRLVGPNTPPPDAPSWLSLPDLLAMQARCFAAGPFWRAAFPPLLALVGLGLLAVRSRRGLVRKLDVGLAAAALVVLALSTALPFHFQLWNFFSPRCVPFWVMFGIALLPIEALIRARDRAIVQILSVGFALCALGWSCSYHIDLARYQADGIALLDAPLKRSGARLPLNLTAPFSRIAYSDPGLNLPMLYILEQGGMVPDLFATRAGIHPHLYRAPVDQLFPKFPGRFYSELFRMAGTAPRFPPKSVQLTWLALLGAAYEDVILISEVADADAFIGRGYSIEQRRGKAAILRYRGCGMTVQINLRTASTVPLLIDYGWSPVFKSADQHVVPAGFAGGQAASFPAAPCGPVWVRVAWDEDRSGQVSAADRYCREANAMHVIDSAITPEHDLVTCSEP